jgi:hypothetical protein
MEGEMKRMIQDGIGAWLRGLVWTAMIAGCAWASAQSYLVAPSTGHYHTVAMGAGEGVGLGQGIGVDGGQSTQPLPKDDLFAGTEIFAKGAADITEITMDPDSLNMVGGNDERRARSMVLNVVRTYTYDKPGMYNMSDVDAIRNKLNTGDWHCSVHIRDLKNGTGSDVCGKRRTDGMKETAIIEVEQKQLTFIHTIRRSGGPGSSEMGFFPMLPGLSPMTMMAMTNPEALADMHMGMHGMPFMYATPGMHVFTFNSEDMKGKMDDMKEQLKDLKVRPFDEQQMQEMRRFRIQVLPGAEAPVAPPAPTPHAAPAPPAPQVAPTPQVAPVPAAPQTPQ